MDLTPGMVIAGRYRVETKVGAGGMGEVWSGEHIAVGVRVALKTLLPAAACDHEVVARFKREAFFLGRIRSDHVARVVDFVADEQVGLVLVMDFVEGEPLSKILQTRSLSVEETVDLGVDIVSALCDLHRVKVIHRDLKPGNIIMQPLHDGTHRAVIVDFGVSRALSSGAEADEEMTGITRADMAVGTMEYMAPEQILNSRDVTAASDLYAVGAMLYRAVAGHHLFGEIYDAELAKRKLTTDPGRLRSGRTDRVAQGLEQVVFKALQRRPKTRYESAEVMLAELTALRDLARAAALELDMETTHDTARGIPLFDDPTQPDPSRPSGAGPSSGVGPSTPTRQSGVPVDVRRSLEPEVSSTLPSQAGLPARAGSLTPPSTSRSLPTADMAAQPAPRRRGLSIVAAVLLTVAALVGGVGLGSTWTQRQLTGIVAPEATSVAASAPPADSAVAPADSVAAGEPTEALDTDQEAALDLDLPAPSAEPVASVAPAVAQAPTRVPGPMPRPPAPKPTVAPEATTEPPSTSPPSWLTGAANPTAPPPAPTGAAAPPTSTTKPPQNAAKPAEAGSPN